MTQESLRIQYIHHHLEFFREKNNNINFKKIIIKECCIEKLLKIKVQGSNCSICFLKLKGQVNENNLYHFYYDPFN